VVVKPDKCKYGPFRDQPRGGRWLAAVFACGDSAVLPLRAAGAPHGLRAYYGAAIDVTVLTRSARRQRRIRIYRSTMLTARTSWSRTPSRA
jgi:hypothetical protein